MYGDAHKIISFYTAPTLQSKKDTPQSPHQRTFQNAAWQLFWCKNSLKFKLNIADIYLEGVFCGHTCSHL